MTSRRKFLQNSFIGAAAAATSSNLFSNCTFSEPSKSGSSPIAVTTWKNEIASDEAWKILSSNGYALDAVEAGVRVPEADPLDMSVGYGGCPDRDGNVTLDASIMDELGRAGAVAALREIMHPISVARRVMEKTPHVLLVGDGALQFAVEQGFQRENLLTEKAKEAWEKWKIKSQYEPKPNWERHDTCGMVALDTAGRLCGACTTSGMAFKMAGRVGDSPILGAGLFVDGEVAAVACTGLGELVLRTLGSFLVVEEIRRGAHPMEACETALRRIAKKCPEALENQVGFVAVDRKGQFGGMGLVKGFIYVVHQNSGRQTVESEYLF